MKGLFDSGAGRRFLGLLAAGLGAAALLAPSAQADFGIAGFGGSTSIEGQFSRQAGAHADLRTTFSFNTFEENGTLKPDGTVRDVNVELPPGELGNPTAAPTCTRAELVGGFEGGTPICPISAQVGVSTIEFAADDSKTIPVYNMATPPDAPALFGMNFLGAEILISAGIRPGDHGVDALSARISQARPIFSVDTTLWGVPADPIHDADRWKFFFGWPSPAPKLPFMRNPTSCPGVPASTGLKADSWQSPGAFDRTSFEADLEGIPFRTEGCARLPFDPSIVVQPTSHSAGDPTGLEFQLELPQDEDPYGLSTADVRSATVTLPPGMSVSPAAASGLDACSPAQIGLATNDPSSCPAASRIGTVTIDSPDLEQPLEGDVIVAKQKDNPFGSLLALYLVAEGSGVVIKLPGRVDLDPTTGQLTTSFENTPQLPFSRLTLNLRGGPTAPLTAPKACGRYVTHAEITSWASSTPVSLQTPMNVDEGCGRDGLFEPRLDASSLNPVAGAATPFVLRVSGEDDQQNVARIDTVLPKGLLAKLAGVPLCGDAQASQGTCAAASRVGDLTVGVGGGTSPISIPQPGKSPTGIFLGGPYAGEPYSLVFEVPAQTGPFDLGTVVTRGAIHIDPVSAQASVRADPLPQILEGIPVAYRTIEANIDRADFIRNPTSCEPSSVDATIVSALGAVAKRSARFQLADCAALGFKPTLSFTFSGPTHRRAYPGLRAVLKTRPGDANLSRAVVALPKTEFIENAHIRTVCTRVQYAADKCPPASIYGYAKAWSPLLDQPLQGPVYLRSSNHKLPDLVASLDGQIHIDLDGRIDSVDNRIRNTFESIPDAPVSKFVLTMQGGKKGLLVNNTDLCATTPRASVQTTGQNGKSFTSQPVVKVDCGRKSHH
jgi:hypothetical protein